MCHIYREDARISKKLFLKVVHVLLLNLLEPEVSGLSGVSSCQLTFFAFKYMERDKSLAVWLM